ncbi:MAG: FkbM family methyltransferase [Chloroflexi bacterium]|nr:FkbM family methyltransferase [Chloroflexota bacterium]
MNKNLKAKLRRFMPKIIRSWTILAGPLKGSRIVTSWHDYPAAIMGRTERPLLEWFGKNVRPDETWLDIGAHYGYTAIEISRLVGTNGRVFAFEPMLSTAGYLTQTRQINKLSQLTVLPFALGDPHTFGLKQLPTVRGMADSTIPKGTWSETLLVARLDWLWSQVSEGRERIDGVKIDVQGMEVEVLRGMSELLRLHKPKLVIEVHPGINRTELLDLLESVGYSRRASPIEPINGETEPRFVDDRSYAFTLR